MAYFCKDRDILATEPVVFLTSAFAGQKVAAGGDGVISGTSFSSVSADFTQARVEAGMVLCVYSTIPSEGAAYEILSVDSAAGLTVSVLRADESAAAIAPPAGTALKYQVLTYQPQIAALCAQLAEKLRTIVESSGINSADFADSAQLRQAAVCGTLAKIFAARAENSMPGDPNWIKSGHYAEQFAAMRLQLRLAVDADGDGLAEQTRSLGNVSLRRS
ncbi:MAG: hypothetical protein HZA50_04480 [Planctomycetes bacterium]|nr:hypothetical protein [Planctomycetota bacterium]